MLLKCSPTEKRTKISVNTKQQRSAGNMKLTVGTAVTPRLHRKIVKGFGSKRPIVVQNRILPEQKTAVDPCDNSNDSGLGFEQHLECAVFPRSTLRFSDQEPLWANEHPEVKRKKLEIKLESDDANDNFSFPETMNRIRKDSSELGGSENTHPNVLRVVERRGPECLTSACNASLQRPPSNLQRSQMRPQPRPTSALMRRPASSTSLTSQLLGVSRDGKAHLQIVCQPEQQHRARYQTEGSRGAVKDRSGNGFPIVKLVGYNKPTTLQVFIGTDVGRVAPHMFYQACRVSGKNSTPCVEKKIDGTVVIEVNFDPTKDMTITCDCVGILKERNVDVEHRFPDQTGTRNKKKSTRCRMVFRTTVTHPDGSTEVLQTTSQPIVCTQPPGIPEICKKSLVSCPCTGGMELFILGKNFLKDTRVVFQQNDLEPVWEDAVQPDKEFLQQTHLVCTVPPYRRCDLVEPVVVKLFVMSSGKTSEPHTFTYTPANNPLLQPAAGSTDIPQSCLPLAQPVAPSAGVELERVFVKPGLVSAPGLMVPGSSVKPAALENQFLASDSPQSGEKKDVHPIRLWATSTLLESPEKLDDKRCRENQQSGVLGHKLMPPPPALLPIAARRASSTRLIIPDSDPSLIAADLKTEMIDENSEGASQLSPEDLKGIDLRMKPAATPQPIATVTDLMCTQSPSMATFRQFVSSSTDTPLPAQSGRSVESYLSRLESSSAVKPNAENNSSASTVSSVSELSLNNANKIQTGVDSITSSLMFQTAQQTANLINNNRTSVPGTQQKNPFTSEVPLSNMFSSESSVGMEKEKTGYVESSTLQEAIAASLVANLNSVGSENQRKVEYGPPPVSVHSQPMPPGILTLNNTLPSVSESQLNNYQASSESDAAATALRVSPIMNNISQPSEIIQTAASLIFRNTPTVATKNIIPTLSVSHKSDDQLMESLSKPGDQSSMLTSSTSSASDSMNLQAPSSSVNQHFQTESALMSAPSDSRLEALVSSAIENHILTSDHQSQVAVTQKLNALVNSAAECHIINQCSLPISSKSIGLNAQTTDLHSDTSNQSSPNLRLEQSVPPATDFQLNSRSSSQQPVQISQNSVLNDALNGHVLDSKQAGENLALNMNGENMMVDTSPSSDEVNSRLLVRSPRSPIAIKAMILNSAVPTSVENQILVPSPTCTSSIAVKSMVLSSSPLENELHLPNTSCTSPIAIKSMLVSSAAPDENILVTSSNAGSSIAVKNILNSSSINDEVHLSHSNCTSPIAMKKLILESSAALVNDIHSANSSQCPSTTISSILNSQVSGSSVLSTASTETSSLSAENAKINVLVQSTVNDHILASSPNESSPPVLAGVNLNSTLLASRTVPTPMADSPQLQQGSLIITQAPSVPSSCSTTSISPASAQGVEEQLQHHITSMFVTSNSESSVQTINYTSGSSSLQPPIAQGGCVTNTACYSTADSNSNTCLASKLPELNVSAQSNGSATFVDQMLMGLAAGGERKNQLETPMITETNISKTIQEPEFLTAQSKISENEMFVTANGLKPTGNSIHNNMSRIMTKLDVAAATAQEIPSSANALPVPVAEMSDAIQTTKEAPVITTTAVVTSTVQKKSEEGMVPQELTQMSENDLLSYINPSCFDQVL
ncbi:nuclear factor of activated T-cells 5 [Anabrus simplex]|uniref:nuclear factor of activated T-cells 5 n=1 Tax=Anabrus simplex TaxID=316456 RepID=UPI0035A397C7